MRRWHGITPFGQWHSGYDEGAVTPFPASLYLSGETGPSYNVSPDNCFTDTGGTTGASVGDPVARLNDISGNDQHATQATLAARPILRQTGSLYYLEFDGTDDELDFPALTTTGDLSLSFAATGDTSGDQAMVLGGGGASLVKFGAVSTTRDFFFRAVDGGTAIDQNVANWQTTPAVLTGERASGTTRGFYNNGTEISGFTNAGATGFSSIGFADSRYARTDFYGAVIIDRVLTTSERTAVAEYLAGLSGVTL